MLIDLIGLENASPRALKPTRPDRATLPVTREMVYARTRALALCAGRIPPLVLQIDYEQAKREVTGESEPERQEAVLVAATPPPIASLRMAYGHSEL